MSVEEGDVWLGEMFVDVYDLGVVVACGRLSRRFVGVVFDCGCGGCGCSLFF